MEIKRPLSNQSLLYDVLEKNFEDHLNAKLVIVDSNKTPDQHLVKTKEILNSRNYPDGDCVKIWLDDMKLALGKNSDGQNFVHYYFWTVNKKEQELFLDVDTKTSDARWLLAQRFKQVNDFSHLVFVVENVIIPLENDDKPLFLEVLKILIRIKALIVFPLRIFVVSRLSLFVLERDSCTFEPTVQVDEAILKSLVEVTPATTNVFLKELNMGILPLRFTWRNYENVILVRNHTRALLVTPIVDEMTKERDRMSQSTSSTSIEPCDHLPQTTSSLSGLSLSNNNPPKSVSYSISFNVTSKNSTDLLSKLCNMEINRDLSTISLRVDEYPLLIALPYDKLLCSELKLIQSSSEYCRAIHAEGRIYPLENNGQIYVHELGIPRGSLIHLRFFPERDEIQFKRNIKQTNERVKINLDEETNMYIQSKTPKKIKIKTNTGWKKVDKKEDDDSIPSIEPVTLVMGRSRASIEKVKHINCSICHLQVVNNKQCSVCYEVFCSSCLATWNLETPTCPRCRGISEFSKHKLISKVEEADTDDALSELIHCYKCNTKMKELLYCPICVVLYCSDCCDKVCGKCGNSLVNDRAINHYVAYLIEIAQADKSPFPLVKWNPQPVVPILGSIEENRNRSTFIVKLSVECPSIMVGESYTFPKDEEAILEISESPEYFCPRSNQLACWDNIHQYWYNVESWGRHTNDKKRCEISIPHSCDLTLRNQRLMHAIPIDNSFLDSRWHFDFRKVKDEGVTYRRGCEPYIRPIGYYRFAINVQKKYKNRVWLREGTEDEVWPVAYCGTKTVNILNILASNLQAGGVGKNKFPNGNVYGNGIYMTPSTTFAESYAPITKIGNCGYRVIFQLRVEPGSYVKKNQKVWTIQNPSSIRPYGILINEIVI